MTKSSFGRYAGLAIGVGLIAVALSGTSAGPAVAQTFKPVMSFIVNNDDNPVPVRQVASKLTHLGRRVSDLVELWWVQDCFRRKMATGVFEPECFTTPSGQAVIITDVRWRQSLPTVPPGTLIEFLIASHDPTGRQAFRAWAVTREFGQVFGEHHLESGFVFLDGMRHNFADLHGGPTIVLNGYRVTEN